MLNWKNRSLLQRQVYLSVFIVLALSLVVATSVNIGPNSENNQARINVGPGANQGNNVLALNFTVEDGGDTVLNGSVDVGEHLYLFEENGTMFLNQSHDSTRGVNGYNVGEDIFNVSVIHTGLSQGMISGEVVAKFSRDTLYAEGGNLSNGLFDGANASTVSELVVRDLGSREGLLDRQDFVVVNGTLNASNFSDEVLYADSDQDGYFDDAADAIVRNYASGNRQDLEDGDTVLRSGGGLVEFGGSGYQVSFMDGSDEDGYYEDGNAIIRDRGFYGILESVDDRLVNGDARLVDAASSNLSFFDTLDNQAGFDIDGEPIYFESFQDYVVNASNDTRIGDATVTSVNDSDPTTVDLNLETMKYINSSESAPQTNDIGKKVLNVSSENNYPGQGQFWVFEYDDNGVSADGEWDPEEANGDQEILIYDLDAGSDISAGETLLFNSDPANDNVSVDVGEEFGSDIDPWSNSYQISTEMGYLDNGSGSFEAAADNVSVNVSSGGPNWSVVNLAPVDFSNTLGGAGTFTPKTDAFVRFWNASDSTDNADPVADGLYVDVDNSSNVTHGDVRIGEWTVQYQGGTVEKGDVDIGVQITSFAQSKAAYLDADNSSNYTASNGRKASDGREAIISNTDNDLQVGADDVIIREGLADMVDFKSTSPEITYYDTNSNSTFDYGEAIVKNSGNNELRLEEADNVLTSGSAALVQFNESERYIESGGAPGFEQGSTEAIIFDKNADGIIDRGYLTKSDGDDHVIASGDANLENFTSPPSQENESGLVFLNTLQGWKFNHGEDILNLTLVTNGSDSNSTNATEIFNFASTTKHNGTEHYEDGEAIVNDTDGNSVFRDIFKGIQVSNTVTGDHVLNYTHLMDGEIELFRDVDGDRSFDRSADEKLTSLTESGSTTWTSSGFSENITSDETFFLTFNSTGSIPYDAYVDLKAQIDSVQLEGGESLSGQKVSSQVQRIDAYPPQLKTAITGFESGGNNTERKRIRVIFDEQGSLLNTGSIDDSDFVVEKDDIQVVTAYLSSNSKQVILELNSTLATNETPRVNHTGDVSDNVGNKADSNVDISSEDGIRPNITKVRYQDNNADARIDEIDVFFTENVSYDSFEAGDWAVTDNNITSFTVSSGNVSDSNMLELNASAVENVTGVQSGEPELNFTQQGNIVYDNNMNSLSTVENITVVDDAGPAIINAVTFDPDSDSRVESISLNFSERINDSESVINSSAFNVTGGSVVSADSVVSDDTKIELTVTGLETSSTPNITLQSGYIYDRHGNAAVVNQEFNATVDGARPVMMHSEIEHEMSNSNYTIVEMEFSEEVMDTSVDDEGVNISGKQLEFQDTGLDNVHTVNFSEPLQTGDMPNVTGLEKITDADGNRVIFRDDTENITVRTFRKQIFKGWNFVSFPIADSSDPEIEEVLNTSRISVVWTYYDGSWKTYDTDAPDGSNDFTRFEGGRGYLINATEEFVLTPNVNNLRNPSKFPQKTLNFPSPGWALLGQFQEFDQDADALEKGAFRYLGESNLGRVWAQQTEGEASDLEVVTDGGDENVSRELQVGESYWVDVINEASYTWN